MQATMQIIHELTTLGDSLMWIVGPGHMVSENYSQGMQPPQVHGKYVTIRADNWLFHLEPVMVGGIEFVETFGDLTSHYVRFLGREGETLLRAYLPRPHGAEAYGAGTTVSPAFQDMRERHAGASGVACIRREVRSS